jgi:hypothetical protein
LLRFVQGDQIGANFRPLGDCLLLAVFLKMTKVAQYFAYIFCIMIKSMYVLILAQMDWAAFWAIFLHNHLVTLVLFNFATDAIATLLGGLGDLGDFWAIFLPHSSGHPGFVQLLDGCLCDWFSFFFLCTPAG